MNLLVLAIASVMTLNSCDSNSKTAESKSQMVDSSAENGLVNGITDANKGSRTGNVEVKGAMIIYKEGKLYLWSTQGKTTFLKDSTTVSNYLFSFGNKAYDQGIYMLGTAEKNMCPVIINPSEPVCEIGFRTMQFESSLYAINSKENEGWATYMSKEPALLKAIKDAKVGAAKSPGMKAQFEQQGVAKETELLQLQVSLIKEYPNTHLAKILTWKQEPNKTDIKTYWDNIDFSDESVVRSKVLTDRIESFMRSFSKGEESGFINCIATVAEKAKANDRVLEFSLNQMLTGFYESGMENISAYIIDNYVNGDACGDADLSNIIKSTAESIQNLSVGKTPPNISLTGLDGKNVDLYSITKKNKYTLVMFWSSWCEHCKGEAPDVNACYKLWHAKGFEIIGVSIDRNKIMWDNAVKERGFTFPNVCGMAEYQSPVAKDYRVTRTPTFFLLDSNKQIVLKPKGIREAQAYLAAHLK